MRGVQTRRNRLQKNRVHLHQEGGLIYAAGDAALRTCIAVRFGYMRHIELRAHRVTRGAPELRR